MTRLERLDRILIFSLLPLFLVVLAIRLNSLVQTPSPKTQTSPSKTSQTTPKASETRSPAQARAPLWHNLPLSLSLVFVGLVCLLRSWRREPARLFFIAAMLIAMGELSPLMAGTQPQWDHFLFGLGGSLGMGVVVAFTRRFPLELQESHYVSLAWAYLAAALDAGTRILRFVGFSYARWDSFELVIVGDAIVGLILCGVLVHNYVYCSKAGRQRGRWAIYGVVLGYVPWFLISALSSQEPGFVFWYGIAYTMTALCPVGLLIAILADDALEIDGPARLALSLLGVLLLVVLVIQLLVPWTAQLVHQRFGFSSGALQFLLTLALTALIVWSGVRLYPALMQRFLPEHNALSRGMQELQKRPGVETSPRQALLDLAASIEAAAHPTAWAAYVYEKDALVCIGAAPDHAEQLPASLSTEERDALLQEEREILEGWQPQAGPSSDLSCALLLRCEPRLIGVLWLGMKRSRQPYSEADRLVFLTMLRHTSELLTSQQKERQLRLQEKLLHSLQSTAQEEREDSIRRLASLSHDMKQPVEAIRLLSELLTEQPLDARTQRLVENLHQSAHALRALLMDTLERARQHDGPLRVQRSTFLLSSLQPKLEALFQGKTQQKALELRFSFGDAMVHSDPLLLERILANLISNALSYTEEGFVEVSASLGEEDVRICVADTGVGFPLEARQQAFEAWERLGEKSEDGHGLGLTIVLHMAALLEIPVVLDSTPGEGSTFSLLVPQAQKKSINI